MAATNCNMAVTENLETKSWNFLKRKFVPGDPIFEEGDLFCSLAAKQLPIEEDVLLRKIEDFLCSVVGCGKVFDSLVSYESHYNSVHRNVCSICRRIFPSNHLLELHLLESHDSMFPLLAAQTAMYQCLVISCKDKFSNIKERRNHMILVHKYPANYRFDRQIRKRIPNLQTETIVTNDEMDTSVACEKIENKEQVKSSPPKRHFVYKVPQNVCFGQGSVKSFRSYGNKNKPKKGKRQWYQNPNMETDTKVDLETVDMGELASAIDQ